MRQFQYYIIICNHRFSASLAVALVLQFLCRKAGENSLYPVQFRNWRFRTDGTGRGKRKRASRPGR